ncbi:PREDICTED: guanine deaminase-like, partial [Priapulus caudatus]|uniref:Guanine deaminase n=1 Tax=Priapulus caudatus TaxID=37621 RepID=A0ABM1F407_PRICU
ICFVDDSGDLKTLQDEYRFNNNDIQRLKPSQFIIPGFIDSHVHAAQYYNTGCSPRLKLLDWLQAFTFPLEAKFSDTDFAQAAYTKAVMRLLRHGTTTASYFATIHTDSSLKLAEITEKLGQRAFIGKVSMDVNDAGPYYVESSLSVAVKNCERFVNTMLKKGNPLVAPSITPRFALSCTGELMKELAVIADRSKLNIQTHISENREECRLVRELYPNSQHYTDVYDRAGLLSEKTVLAHGVYLHNEEMQTISSRGSGISHCPNSNMTLRSGLCNTKRLLQHGIDVGLGTDMSGGYSASILDAIRYAVQTSNILHIDCDLDFSNEDVPIGVKDTFRMATLGGAEVLNIDDKVGNFVVGKDFDALVVDVSCDTTGFDVFEDESPEDKITKFLFLGDDRNIQDVFVAGRRVVSGAKE